MKFHTSEMGLNHLLFNGCSWLTAPVRGHRRKLPFGKITGQVRMAAMADYAKLLIMESRLAGRR